MIRQKTGGFSVFILIVAAGWLMGYSLFMTDRVMETVRSSLHMFAHTVLPSLVLFSFCSKLIVKLGVMKKMSFLPFSGFLNTVGMSMGGFITFLIGCFSGFPMGASMLSELCERGEISRQEAESLLPFCNQAGISFLFGTVGGIILNDASAGIVFFLAQTVTAWLCICLTVHERYGSISEGAPSGSMGSSWVAAVTASVRESAFSMIGVCGFVIFFSLVGTAFFDTLLAIGFPFGNFFRSVVGGLLEISCGFIILSESGFSQEMMLILSGVFLGFGGCSVFLQAVEKTEAFFFSPQKYFKGKLLSGLICPVFTVMFFSLYKKQYGKILIIVSFLILFCFFYFLNYVKIKFFSKKCGKMKRNAV